MKKLTIAKVGVLSAAKIAAVLGVVAGFLGGAIYAVVFTVIGASQLSDTGEGVVMLGMGAGAICVLPVVYGALSFVFGALYAFLFNVASRFLGGLEVEVEEGAASESF